MGCDLPRWTPPGDGTLDRAVADAAVARRRSWISSRSSRNLELKNAYPGTHATSNAAFLSAAKAKWTESTDYYLGTTVDQIAAQQIGQRDAAAVARAGDGSAADGRPVRQRLRLRLPEQPLVVVADDAAAGRGASAHRVRAAVRRRRQRRRAARGAAASAPACSIGFATTSRGCRASSARRIARRVSQYLDTVREVERRIQKAEAADRGQAAAGPRPSGRRAGRLCATTRG